MAIEPAKAAANVPDGVYLNMTDDEYFAQDALGSSDLVKLHFAKWGWWWQSRHNPDRKPKETKDQVFGQALHAIVLESVDAYESRFAIQPDKAEFDGLLVTVADMHEALEKAGYALDGTSKWKAADWAMACRQNMPDVPCWPNILADFEETLGPEDRKGRPKVITAPEDRMLRFMRDVLMNEAEASSDPKTRQALSQMFAVDSERPPLAEVAIFVTLPDGTRRRWKIDRMFPAFDMDLKSLGNWKGRPLRYEVGKVLARSGWDLQRADYWNGRKIAYELIRQGKLFGGTIEQRKWLQAFPEKHPEWDWVWLAYQKPDPAGRAPIVFPVWDDSWVREGAEIFPSELRRYGMAKVTKALAFYRSCVAQFGLSRPWAKVEALHYTDSNRDPHIVLPHYIAEDEPTEAEAYAGSLGYTPDGE